MNKTIISWTHYVYVTITASVLAYVTVMDSSSSSEEDSAINMLPNIDTISNSQSPDVDEILEPEIVEEETVEPEIVEAEIVEPEIVEAELVNEESIKNDAEPKQQSQSGSSGGKLKKNKTKTNNKNKKANKTRGRK